MRVAYLGPAGTFSEDALRAASAGAEIEPLPCATIYDAITAVEAGRAERALVPFENSIEGSVRATLDALAFDTESVAIVGEHDHPISNSLIAARDIDLDEIEAVYSHPQASAQCSRFIRAELPQRRGPQRFEHRRGGADRRRERRAMGGARRAVGGGDLRRGGPARLGRGRGRQRHALRLVGAGRHHAPAAAGRGRRRSASPSSARTIRAPWSTR